MNFFDIVIIIILSYSLIRGLFRGIIKELSSIVGVIAGFYAAYTYHPELAHILSKWISATPYLNILGFLILFCVIFIIISILGLIIKYILNIAYLGWLDRIFGAAFGIVKGMLIVAVLFIMITTFLPKESSLIKDSQLSPHVAKLSEVMIKFSSKEMKKEFKTKIEEFKKAWLKHE